MASVYDRIKALGEQDRTKGIGQRRSTPSFLKPADENVGRGPLGGNASIQKPGTVIDSTGKVVAQQIVVNPAAQARRQLVAEQEEAEKRRVRGRTSTLLTSPGGLMGSASVTRRTLLGA